MINRPVENSVYILKIANLLRIFFSSLERAEFFFALMSVNPPMDSSANRNIADLLCNELKLHLSSFCPSSLASTVAGLVRNSSSSSRELQIEKIHKTCMHINHANVYVLRVVEMRGRNSPSPLLWSILVTNDGNDLIKQSTIHLEQSHFYIL